ncbi:DUF6386 family protein [Celerinatantimonas sp. MCCC 1A17872]|uniref:DUF6386 family protein n=1 Tax=Celerinatantimonas sp. MCCC 1A17872 TaxID=3177514 RepID=UPI0038C2D0B4
MQTTIVTDTATVVVYDLGCLKHRVADDCDWWSIAQDELKEVNCGNACFLNLGCDGEFITTLVDAVPNDCAVIRSILVKNISGQFFIGAAEWVSGDGLEPTDEYGSFINVSKGVYQLKAGLRANELFISLKIVNEQANNYFGDLVRLNEL